MRFVAKGGGKMKNIDDWKQMISEVTGFDVEYSDSVSILTNFGSGYIVIEDTGNGLQLQHRRSLDHSDIDVEENIIVDNKIIIG